MNPGWGLVTPGKLRFRFSLVSVEVSRSKVVGDWVDWGYIKSYSLSITRRAECMESGVWYNLFVRGSSLPVIHCKAGGMFHCQFFTCLCYLFLSEKHTFTA